MQVTSTASISITLTQLVSLIEIRVFVYGHSLAENDEHYLKRIERGKLSHLFVGIYGNPDSPANKAIIARAKGMNVQRRRKVLNVQFFDAGSAKVWGK